MPWNNIVDFKKRRKSIRGGQNNKKNYQQNKSFEELLKDITHRETNTSKNIIKMFKGIL